MDKPIKVLVADDSIAMRKILADTISQTDQVELVKLVCNGAEAVEHFLQCLPDVVVLDAEMPVMSGIDAADAIAALNPNIPIILFSAEMANGTPPNPSTVNSAIRDHEIKPPIQQGRSKIRARLSDHLIPKIISWGKRRRREQRERISRIEQCSLKLPKLPRNQTAATSVSNSINVIAVGGSTGATVALKDFLIEFPSDFNIPIVIVQHLLPSFTKSFADRLDNSCPLSVSQAKAGNSLRPGTALIAPGDFHMKVVRRGTDVVTALDQREKINFCRPSVDVLFESVAQVYGGACLGVILTGMGKDGLTGSQAIHERGGTVIAQDECSSVVWGMPGAVVEANLASCVLPPDALAHYVLKVTNSQQLLQRVQR